MKRRFLLVGSLAFSTFLSNAQRADSTRQRINETEIEYLYNHYTQNGNNSPITGGVGTEKLTVYGPSLKIKRIFDKNTISFQGGTDLISSASTDNIDAIVSSASKLDARTYADVHYTRYFEKQQFSLSAGFGKSIESDYYSTGHYFGFSKASKDNMRTFSGQLQIFKDDLRWGRLNPKHRKPIKLIYPAELRTKEWFDKYNRNSTTLNLNFTQVIDMRNVLGVSSVISVQKGLLSTPFHRVIFNDETRGVEQLPGKKQKFALALKWNRFVGGNVIVKNTLNGYSDNFGVRGVTLENETAIKLNPKWTLMSKVRFYSQKASRYFAPFEEHSSQSDFYTSDFDLSNFKSYKIGFGGKYRPANNKSLKSINAKYLFYTRSNGLKGHIMSLIFNFKYKGKILAERRFKKESSKIKK